jgi:hypothetical protein
MINLNVHLAYLLFSLQETSEPTVTLTPQIDPFAVSYPSVRSVLEAQFMILK